MKRSRAWSLIRKQPHYRHEAFLAGLSAAGFDVLAGVPDAPHCGDVLVIWNRYGEHEVIADRFEAAGGHVLVAENGYLGAGGTSPKADVAGGPQPGHYYALARHAHNGRGQWPDGGPERFQALGVTLKPWRDMDAGKYVLVAPNRSFGMRGGIMPNDWAERAAADLRRIGFAVRIRRHPGNMRPDRSLEEDLAEASWVRVWSSSVGVRALIEGLRVAVDAPWWICKNWQDVGRERALQRMAWAQWTVDEIANGTAIRALIDL